jgi:hypothetical protein
LWSPKEKEYQNNKGNNHLPTLTQIKAREYLRESKNKASQQKPVNISQTTYYTHEEGL